ncbi:hypothetical protein F5X99DRAFT_199302 [Biscogniauxia marginata]|nr:hypothetical protein F5X99DRAFT_199302 [Biscogniauxia marginata]
MTKGRGSSRGVGGLSFFFFLLNSLFLFIPPLSVFLSTPTFSLYMKVSSNTMSPQRREGGEGGKKGKKGIYCSRGEET